MMQSDLILCAYKFDAIYNLTVARHYLRETLAIANDAELNKLTASALVLLAQIYLALGTRKVCTSDDSIEYIIGTNRRLKIWHHRL